MEQNVNKRNLIPQDIAFEAGSPERPSLMQAGILYFAAVLLLLLVGTRVQRSEFYSGSIITEFMLVLSPSLLLLFIFKYDVKSVLRLNGISVSNLLLILCIMVFAIPLVGVFNYGNILLVKLLFGKVALAQPPAASNLPDLVLNIIVIGLSAGICEEVMFRGIIQRSLERFGAVKAILMASLLFALMHLDFQKLFGTFLLGALIGFIVFRTNSIFGGMFAHFSNNTIAVVMSYVVAKVSEKITLPVTDGISQQSSSDLDLSSLVSMPRLQLIASLIFLLFVLITCASVFTGLMTVFIKNTAGISRPSPASQPHSKIKPLLWMLPGISIIAFIYFAQGLRLKGISLELVNSVLRVLQ